MPEYLIMCFNTAGFIIQAGFFDAFQILGGGCREQFLQEGIPV